MLYSYRFDCKFALEQSCTWLLKPCAVNVLHDSSFMSSKSFNAYADESSHKQLKLLSSVFLKSLLIQILANNVQGIPGEADQLNY